MRRAARARSLRTVGGLLPPRRRHVVERHAQGGGPQRHAVEAAGERDERAIAVAADGRG